MRNQDPFGGEGGRTPESKGETFTSPNLIYERTLSELRTLIPPKPQRTPVSRSHTTGVRVPHYPGRSTRGGGTRRSTRPRPGTGGWGENPVRSGVVRLSLRSDLSALTTPLAAERGRPGQGSRLLRRVCGIGTLDSSRPGRGPTRRNLYTSTGLLSEDDPR